MKYSKNSHCERATNLFSFLILCEAVLYLACMHVAKREKVAMHTCQQTENFRQVCRSGVTYDIKFKTNPCEYKFVRFI